MRTLMKRLEKLLNIGSITIAIGVLLSVPAESSTDETNAQPTASAVFERRIQPLAASGANSSCKECHFGGVELGKYIHADQATTFAALRDQGLIDVEQPDDSKILTFISRHGDDSSPLIQRVRKNELAAFRTWIRLAVEDPELLKSKANHVQLGTELPLEVIRHMRSDRILRSYVENIWSEIGRCINCHSPERNERLVEENGEQMSWIQPNDPAATLQYCVDQGLIDLDSPEESLILEKPLVLVEHGGGPKFIVGSRTDKNFRRFLNDFAAVHQGRYKAVADLPEASREVSVLTDQQMRIVDIPDGLDSKLLRVDIYRWTGAEWSSDRWGTAESSVVPERNMWQNVMLVVAPRDSDRAQAMQQQDEPRLPGGRYLARIFVDREDRLKQDRDAEFSDEDLLGEVEFEGPWPPGYQPPKIIHAPGSD